ncbi:4-alpha-glucanotransferase [Rubrobacter taiwanensis]|uniref:4-alpha-glucanotransferase n=1 Tax=Rubrobacter taiwanensis TaxID=185139 RepID=A0A4R1BSG3_9ACTN|nr:4-alpha-glucanotransferase [Rubrobacter taiwanensis]TCJ20568.1 4-alpha-glucanotransferase [Rubrobacter taiwanensis]
MRFARSGGVLLHPTSLPGGCGIGELGPEAYRFLDFLHAGGQRIWQMLPLGPVGPDGSPYRSYSAFAGNPLLISTERLVRDGLLDEAPPDAPGDAVDHTTAGKLKRELLRRAHLRFVPPPGFRKFCRANGWWLEDYALFTALKRAHGGRAWNEWGRELRTRDPAALEEARRELADELEFQRFAQYLFFRHFWDLRRAANGRGVRIFGDIPIFVAHDSADVWANQHLFHLDSGGDPSVVAGVPPDYFSETGQLWGNPLYDWSAMEREGYGWWKSRLRMALSLCDIVRVDHFRGFEAYWEIPAGEPTARNGRWVEGPGARLFETLRAELGELPVVAENLGTITPEVERLRRRYELPGMKVLQFAFTDPENEYLPHNYTDPNFVVYTGTHDNDTTPGWWASATEEERSFARRYLGREEPSVWDFVRLALSSVADVAVIPMQDLLELGSEARMNTPGTPAGNWQWRMRPDAAAPQLAQRLRELSRLYNR